MKEMQVKHIADGLHYSRTVSLGKGAYGEVFLGFDQNEKQPIAVKVVNLQKIMSQDHQQTLMKKLKDEIVNMQLVKNEHIVELLVAKFSKRNLYIICEYCNGENLDKFIKNRGYLTEREARGYFKEIIKGFYHLYQKNIVHRDLKPANLLMHNYYIKIADLGFSKSTEGHEQLLESSVGTPLYMSPQIFSKQKYTTKTDIWSLGVIFFQMLYGRVPWHGCNSLFQLKERVRNEELKFPQFPIVTKTTKNLIRQMLDVEEKDRINWETLFSNFLTQNTNHLQISKRIDSIYVPTISFSRYFRQSYFIESQLHLPKILQQLQIVKVNQLTKYESIWESVEDYFSNVKLMKDFRSQIDNRYKGLIEKRNQVSFLIVMMTKMWSFCSLSPQSSSSLYIPSLTLLIFKYAIATIQQLLSWKISTELINEKGKKVQLKLCYEAYLHILFERDLQILKTEIIYFQKYFNTFLNLLSSQNGNLYLVFQKQLSGIYENENGDLRIVRFFVYNYLKSLMNTLKEEISSKEQIEEKMIDEQEQIDEKSKVITDECVVIKMGNEYLQNAQLFDLKIQQSNIKTKKPIFQKNLNQMLSEWETSPKDQFYQELLHLPRYEIDSITTLINKEFKWSPINCLPTTTFSH